MVPTPPIPWQVEQLALNFCSPSRNSDGAEATVPVPFGSTPFWLHAGAAATFSTTIPIHIIDDDFIGFDDLAESIAAQHTAY